MKFLVIQKVNDDITSKVRGQLFNSSDTWFKKHRETGKCVQVYGMVGMPKVLSIWDVASPEEFLEIIPSCPLEGYSAVDVVPIIEFDVASQHVNKAFSEIKE